MGESTPGGPAVAAQVLAEVRLPLGRGAGASYRHGDRLKRRHCQPPCGMVLQIDETDFILHFGDLSYAMGRGYLWETFGNLIDPFASRAPYMVSVGYVGRFHAVHVAT